VASEERVPVKSKSERVGGRDTFIFIIGKEEKKGRVGGRWGHKKKRKPKGGESQTGALKKWRSAGKT